VVVVLQPEEVRLSLMAASAFVIDLGEGHRNPESDDWAVARQHRDLVLSGDRLVEEVQQSPVGQVYLARQERDYIGLMVALRQGPTGMLLKSAFVVAAALAFAEVLMVGVHRRWQLQRLDELVAEVLIGLP